MKIVFLTTSSLESPYTLGRCLPIARKLATAGHDVHIVALHHHWTSSTPRHFCHQGVYVHYVGQMHVQKIGDRSLYFGALRLLWVVFMGMVHMVWQAVALRADCYHVGKPHPQNACAGLIARHVVPGARLILDYDDLETAVNYTVNPLQRWVLSSLEDHLPRRVDAVTVHSTFLADRIEKLGVPPDQIVRLPTAVDSERFRHKSPGVEESWRKRLRLDKQRVVIYFGTLSLANHAVDLLLHAFALLCRTHDDVVLIVVGGGRDVHLLEKLAEELAIDEQCRFTGRVDPSALPGILGLAWISVDPVRETDLDRARWPLKIAESLAAALPVITGDVGDRRAMLCDGHFGLLVKPDSAQALAEGLATFLDDETLRSQLVRNCEEVDLDSLLAENVSTLLEIYHGQ